MPATCIHMPPNITIGVLHGTGWRLLHGGFMDSLGLKQKLISFVFQPICCICDKTVREPTAGVAMSIAPMICRRCHEEITGAGFPRCNFCGAFIRTAQNPFGERCHACHSLKSPLESTISLGDYGGRLQQTIIEIKSKSNDVKARQLGMLLGDRFAQSKLPRKIDLVIPVPSHWRRRVSRGGFHVADVISEGFCAMTGIARSQRAMKSVRNTEKQSKLRPGQRMANVRAAFALRPGFEVRRLRVLMIDDVMTSGATIGECIEY